MGLIKAAINATKGVLADQWKEFFYCDALDKDVLVTKGMKRIGGKSSNTKGSDNIITNGSGIAIADGQAIIIVEQGKIVEFCAEPGEFTFDQSTEPSVFSGDLGDAVAETFKTLLGRFEYGGDTGKDQRVYYFNTKEIMDNKFGTPGEIPFKINQPSSYIEDFEVHMRCSGTYTYRITDPILFYTNVTGNVQKEYTREEIDSTLKSEFISNLKPALIKMGARGVMPSDLDTNEIADEMNAVLSEKWEKTRGIKVCSVSFMVADIRPDEQKKLQEMQTESRRLKMLSNANNAAAFLAGAQGEAMVAAANNANGAINGFVGMNTAAANGGMNAASLFQMGQANNASAGNGGWTCSCGTVNNGKFCSNCGQPNPNGPWTCSCGTANTGKFCSNCGSPRK